MTRYVALLRAVNVGGTGKLAMSDLKSVCIDAGFTRVETYIASGNVVFESDRTAASVKSELEVRLLECLGKSIAVIIRSAAEMQVVLDGNPFANVEPSYAYAIFLEKSPARDALANVAGRSDEELRLGEREIYIHYPQGMGCSKLRVPAAANGTARNMNTVAKLAALASKH